MTKKARRTSSSGPSPGWTVAVYLAGGENVSREMIPALHDMRDATVSNRPALRVLAQFEPDRKSPRLFAFDDGLASHFTMPFTRGRGASTPLGLANYEYVLEPRGGEGEERAPLRRLREFVATSRSAAGEGRCLLVISGHGSGAVGEFLGYRSGGEPLYLNDLKEALGPPDPTRKKIDVLGMDCCNMSMVEVAFELVPYARFLVASEGYILNHGWPYRTILDAIVDLEPEEAGAEIVRQYVGSYSDYALLDVDSHCAVTNLDRIHLLSEPMRRLSDALGSRIEDPDVWRPTVLAHWEAQSYKDEEYVDLADFCERLRMHVGDPDVRSACTEVIAAVSAAVGSSCFSGSAFQFSTGLSVYFPWCHDAVKAKGDDGRSLSDLERYQGLAFSGETGWGEFLDRCLWVTRREPRGSLASPARLAEPRLAGSRENDFAYESSPPRTEKEVTMAIKRFPPWNGKGAPPTTRVKNHPRVDSQETSSIPIRRFPPWNGKGPVESGSRVKNHPRGQKD